MSDNRKEKRTPEPQTLPPKTQPRDESTDFGGGRLEEQIPDHTGVAPNLNSNNPSSTDPEAFDKEPDSLQTAPLNSMGESSSEDRQREALAALSLIIGFPVDQIKLVDIALDSLVMIVELPIVGAAQLVAMQLLRHPMLRAQGFAKLALDGPSSTLFDQALSLELVKLDAKTPESKKSLPYPLNRTKVRLRVTLADQTQA